MGSAVGYARSTYLRGLRYGCTAWFETLRFPFLRAGLLLVRFTLVHRAHSAPYTSTAYRLVLLPAAHLYCTHTCLRTARRTAAALPPHPPRTTTTRVVPTLPTTQFWFHLVTTTACGCSLPGLPAGLRFTRSCTYITRITLLLPYCGLRVLPT